MLEAADPDRPATRPQQLALLQTRPASALDPDASFQTELGKLVIGDCLDVLRKLGDDTVDLVVTSPPYDGQPKHGNGETYDRDWYAGFFMDVAVEIHRVLKPHGSFVLNYRSKRHGNERGTLPGTTPAVVSSVKRWKKSRPGREKKPRSHATGRTANSTGKPRRQAVNLERYPGEHPWKGLASIRAASPAPHGTYAS